MLIASTSASRSSKGAKEKLHELGRKSVPKGDQRILEFAEGDVARSIHIETIEEVTPRSQETPEAAKLVKVDGSTSVRIEHTNHHLHCVPVECSVVPVNQRPRQLGL